MARPQEGVQRLASDCRAPGQKTRNCQLFIPYIYTYILIYFFTYTMYIYIHIYISGCVFEYVYLKVGVLEDTRLSQGMRWQSLNSEGCLVWWCREEDIECLGGTKGRQRGTGGLESCASCQNIGDHPITQPVQDSK